MEQEDPGLLLARARSDPTIVILEGLHPLKHAMRFGAGLLLVLTWDRPALLGLAASLAPDLVDRIASLAVEIGPERFRSVYGDLPPSPALALARRPQFGLPAWGPIVLLENPTHLGNVGAVVRVAAGMGAGAVVTTGRGDPWHPVALRGSAGLHFALPVSTVPAPPSDRPLLLIDAEGETLRPGVIPDDAVLAFGSERRGLSSDMRQLSHRKLAIPMRTGVSSLNLATAAAIVLWTWRLGLPSASPSG